MNQSAAIKNNLIQRIEKIEDLNFLQAIQTILDTSGKALYEPTAEQQKSIEFGREQASKGQTREHSEVMADMKKWLSKG